MGGPDPGTLGSLSEALGQATALPGRDLQSEARSPGLRKPLQPKVLSQTLRGRLLQPAEPRASYSFQLSLRRGENTRARPRNRTGSSRVVFGWGNVSLCATPTAQPWCTEKARRSQPRPRRGSESLLEGSNSRREGTLHRRKCHPGRAAGTPLGAARACGTGRGGGGAHSGLRGGGSTGIPGAPRAQASTVSS